MDYLLPLSPFLLALFLAFTTRRVILSLFCAVLLGSFILHDYAPVESVIAVYKDGIFNHINHVETQIPYAMTTAFLAFIGFIFASITGSNLTVLIMAGAIGSFYFLYSKSQQGRLTHENNLS